MKKVLTIAIVAMLATATLFAGVSFSGRFRQGYVFTFKDGSDTSVKAWKPEEAKFVIKASDDDGLWTVSLKNVGELDSNDKWAANASFNFTKALSMAGINTGDFGLTISLGNNSKMTALSAYKDVTGNELFKLQNNGQESMQLAMSYGKLVNFNIAFDPTTDGGSTVLSAKTSPMDGLAIALAYAYKGYDKGTGTMADNMLGASVDANIAKLANLDFKLGVTAYDNYSLIEDANVNSFATAIYGGVDAVDGFIEFLMVNREASNMYSLNTQVNINAIKDVTLDAYFNIADLENAGDTFSIGADASYTFAGVEFALNADYSKAKKAFSLTPKMIIVF